MRPIKSVIFGCSGYELTKEEKAFFREINPLGLILFGRNIQDPDQVRALVDSFRKCVRRKNAPVLIDQEGGTVQRLKPPHWTKLPAAEEYGDLYRTDPKKAMAGIKKHAKTIAKELSDLGINVDCWPCLDVKNKDHNVMYRRCYGDDPVLVAEMAQVSVDTALKSGLMPIIKHIPGYGRVTVDPHKALPTVTDALKELEKVDFYPFRQMEQPVWGMTAHVIYTALDPKSPATLSKKVIRYIREKIGFDGFLICDDMAMGALATFGTPAQVAQKIIKAGCDTVLHCSGVLEDMVALASHIPDLSVESIKRLKRAEGLL